MNLVINSQFRPFTYDEMVKPLVQYKEAYDKVEQDYSDLATQTEMWKDIVNQENSPEAYAMYKGYSNQLNSIIDDFSKGMTLKNRSALLGMKRDYAKNITPIARASEAMNAANELRVKAGPDAIFEVGEYNSLDQFLHGKTANNRYQSKEALTKKTAAITEAAMAEALKDPGFQKAMGDQYWLITQHTGGSYAELMEAMKLGMLDNPIAQNKFSEIRQRVAEQAGVSDYDYQGRQAIMDAIDTGLYAGLDKPVRSFQANQDHMNPLQKAQIEHTNAQTEYQKEATGRLKAQPGGTTAGGKGSGSSSGKGSDPSTTRANRLNKIIKVRATNKGKGSGGYEVGATWELDEIPSGATMKSYGSLSSEQRKVVDNAIGDDINTGYNYYVIQEDAKGFGTDDDDLVIIVPKETVINSAEDIDEDAF